MEKEFLKKRYEPPEVTLIEMQVEQGYEVSSELPAWTAGEDGYWQ